MNLWDYGVCEVNEGLRGGGRAGEANSINEICISRRILSPALRLRFDGVSAYCSRGKEELVSRASIGIRRTLNYCARHDCAGPPKLCRYFVIIAGPEVPITDLLSLLRNQSVPAV